MPPTMDYAATGANLLESLRNLRRRVKLLSVAYGAGIVLASAVGLVLAVVLLDYLLQLPAGPRIAVNLAALAVLGYAAWICVVRPALARITLSDLAGRIENTFPQFDDTLRSTVIFTQQKDVPGSEVMKFRTVERANTLASQVDLSQAVALKPVWGSIAMGLGALAIFLLIAALVDPNLRKIAADRLFAGDAAWPKSTQIAMISVPAQRVAAGGDIPLSLKLTKGDVKQATIRYRYDNGPWQQEIVRADAGGVFSTNLKAQLDANRDLSKLQIVVEAGDDEAQLAPVEVVPPLEIRQVVATVTPPAYSKLPPVQVNLAERPIVAAVGATADLNITFNKQLDTAKSIRIVPSDTARAAPEVAWTFPRNGQATGRFDLSGGAFKPEDSFRFILRATDTDGFENQSALEYQITIHEDAKPSVVIDEPRQSEDRTPNATVPLRISADDDYGFDSVELVVEGKGPALASHEPWVIPLVKGGEPEAGVDWQLSPNSTLERKRFTAAFAWELDKLAGVTLKPGDKLEFFIRVRDNFDLAGQRHDPVDSSRLTITIISHDQFEAWMENQLSTVRQDLNAIKKTQDVVRSTTEEQSKETKEKGKLDDAQKATMSRLANQQATAASQTKQASQKLSELVKKATENKASEQGPRKAADEVSKQLDRTAEAPMKEATNKLNQAKETKSDPKGSPQQQKESAQQASEALDQASAQQADASKQLEEAMKKLNEFSGLRPAIENLEKIKEEQDKVAKEYKEKLKDALSKNPDALTPEQKKDLKDLTERQDELAKETAKAIKQMEDKADKMEQSKSDPAAAKAMKEAAQTGKSQSVPQKQSNPQDDDGASQQMQKNQQANAQQKHKEIELGLDMMIEKLKAAERAKLEELQKQLAEMEQLLKDLVARQAGHNLDNLLIQDGTGKKITDLSEEERNALFADARRTLGELPNPLPELQVLTPSQERTHRNTVDTAQKAQALPDSAPAGKIFAAGTKMEQAIVHLRASKLPDAYGPQTEALKNLREALKLVEEAKKKTDDEINQQKEESIKQAYVKILERQKKIDEETIELEKNGRDEEGNLKRLAAVRLGPDGLPKEQGELSAEAKKLGEQLAAIKSIVYVWANKDIVNSMNEVKEDLAKPKTDLVVQTQQKRIEEQLEAMIKNLAQKPPEKPEFASRGGGGGGGGGGKPPPRMPTDVELRLLKDLQQAVNKATTIIDAEVAKAGGKKDAEKLVGLGGRQGELRNLLDQLLKAASEGEMSLAPEPKDTEKLPEEASVADIEDQEFLNDLLENKLDADTVEKTIKLVGDRMGRSRQRLALDNDPGKTTQEIQKRIVLDLDNLIKLAQQQQQQGGKPQPGQPGQKPGQPQPGQGEGPQQAGQQGQQPGQQSNGGNQAAADSSMGQGGTPNEDLSKVLEEKGREWGLITDRDRGAVMDSAGETTAEKYRKYVEDYYRELGKKASER